MEISLSDIIYNNLLRTNFMNNYQFWLKIRLNGFDFPFFLLPSVWSSRSLFWVFVICPNQWSSTQSILSCFHCKFWSEMEYHRRIIWNKLHAVVFTNRSLLISSLSIFFPCMVFSRALNFILIFEFSTYIVLCDSYWQLNLKTSDTLIENQYSVYQIFNLDVFLHIPMKIFTSIFKTKKFFEFIFLIWLWMKTVHQLLQQNLFWIGSLVTIWDLNWGSFWSYIACNHT